MLEMGKVYPWKEIVQAYPDKYAFITDYEEEDGVLQNCRLLEICDDKERTGCLEKYLDSGIRFGCRRTSAPLIPFMGGIFLDDRVRNLAI